MVPNHALYQLSYAPTKDDDKKGTRRVYVLRDRSSITQKKRPRGRLLISKRTNYWELDELVDEDVLPTEELVDDDTDDDDVDAALELVEEEELTDDELEEVLVDDELPVFFPFIFAFRFSITSFIFALRFSIISFRFAIFSSMFPVFFSILVSIFVLRVSALFWIFSFLFCIRSIIVGFDEETEEETDVSLEETLEAEDDVASCASAICVRAMTIPAETAVVNRNVFMKEMGKKVRAESMLGNFSFRVKPNPLVIRLRDIHHTASRYKRYYRACVAARISA